MFEIKSENYEEIKESLSNILELINKVKSIDLYKKQTDKIGLETHKIEYFLGGDYKALRLLYGERSSNSKKGCLWCDINLREDLKTDAINIDAYPITLLNDRKDNSSNPSIIEFIPVTHCVIDTLHLLLRISDQLYKLLLLKLKERIDKVTTKDEANLDKRPMSKLFLTFLKETCNLTSPYYFSKKDGLQFRSFNGNERMKIFEKIFLKKMKIQIGELSITYLETLIYLLMKTILTRKILFGFNFTQF